ncbi:MAG: LLM class flavin-dependent oxidoreductase [Gammaproteobacteria bacterium]|jgi:probable F420-dependent oxidoreductase|nr:LLM class F420-dependent oxidoreductase [Chromatiales bacterium]MCP4925299.1 LLM class flavin-dependent oxidoreductase [Gammaproteobacteria bacterium]MDP7152997.1 LLM class flavin-dependent oxidoreductase [Gammaproteobacteria bacterium]MDP7296513.1 LLM class flavin-dependent oxidoreductase [Gammaproteobacteria bacterium]MDP7419941.1 LLM class flavin-dependent oxidoreductase [Gammaproteobacteria bacterium]
MPAVPLTFGIPIPQVFLDGRVDMQLVCTVLRRAEQLGFDSAWVQDQVAGDVPLLESISLLSYAAAVTTKLRLGVSVIVLPIRNAPQLAKNISTLDHMSNGRMILGVGLGPIFAGDNYFQIFGARADEALRRFNENIAIMKSLWTQDKTDIAGEFYTLENTGMEPKPIQQPHPPLWFGGQHPNALRRAVRMADGYMGAGPTTTSHFGHHVEQIRRYLDEEGRDPSTFPISKRVYLGIDKDQQRAKAGLDRFFAARYPWMIKSNPDFVADICIWGSPERVAAGLCDVIDRGARMIVLNPLWDFVEQMEILAAEVIPEVQRHG